MTQTATLKTRLEQEQAERRGETKALSVCTLYLCIHTYIHTYTRIYIHTYI